jgi:hypothetical protein
MVKKIKENIKKELSLEAERIEEDSIHSAKSQFEASDKWKNVNLLLGIPTAIISGIAGISILNEWSYILAGFLALIVGALTTLMTFLNPNQRANAHLNSGNNYLALRNRARIFKNISLNSKEDITALSEELKLLADERNNLNKNSLQCSRKNFETARRGISQGENKYLADNKL